MTPLHTRIEELLDYADDPENSHHYEAFAAAHTAIRILIDRPNSRWEHTL